MPLFVVSACLCGQKVRYDGGGFDGYPRLRRLVDDGRAIAVCPEMLGGLPAPRCPAECRYCPDGTVRVMGRDGADVTAAFSAGAQSVLALCRRFGVQRAILKERSPSCGSRSIYDGSFTGRVVPGEGVTARLLRQNGIIVDSEETWDGLK